MLPIGRFQPALLGRTNCYKEPCFGNKSGNTIPGIEIKLNFGTEFTADNQQLIVKTIERVLQRLELIDTYEVKMGKDYSDTGKTTRLTLGVYHRPTQQPVTEGDDFDLIRLALISAINNLETF